MMGDVTEALDNMKIMLQLERKDETQPSSRSFRNLNA